MFPYNYVLLSVEIPIKNIEVCGYNMTKVSMRNFKQYISLAFSSVWKKKTKCPQLCTLLIPKVK